MGVINFSYKEPKDERIGDRGEVVTTNRSIRFDGATTEEVVAEIKKFESKYDIMLVMTLKEPKM